VCLLESAFEEHDAAAGEPSGTVPLLSFNDYELLEEIARGGMGVVYRARQISLNRIVALKMILGGHLANAGEMQRFRTEAATAAQLQHPNIVAIHEVAEHAGQPFFSMDLIEGRNLAQLARDEALSSRRAAAYLRTIAEAVQYAHSRGVLHRDLKPSNILIDASDQPRITDFGLAKRLDDQSSTTAQLTQTGQVLGSPSFIPPEQAAGQKHAIGPASDVYSLGAILYQLVTGRPPFLADTMTATLRMVAENEPVSPRLLNASVPRDLETICLKCLEKEPKRRYATAKDLADELNRFLQNEPIEARPATSIEKTWRWCRRKPALATALILLLLVAVGSPIAGLRIYRERLQARANKTTAQVMTQFVADMLSAVGPSVAQGRDTAMLKEILERTAQGLGEALKGQPEAEADVRILLGKTYGDLHLATNALEITKQALALRQKYLGPENAGVAHALANIGVFLYQTGDLAGAVKADRDALAMRIKVFGTDHTNVAMSYNNLGVALWTQGKLAEAEEAHTRALKIRRKVLAADHPDIGMSLLNLANVHAAQGKFAGVEDDYAHALDLFSKRLGKEAPLVATLRNNLAVFIAQRGELLAAEGMHTNNLDLRRKIFKPDDSDVAVSLTQLGIVLAARGELDQAEAKLQEAFDMQTRMHPGKNSDLADSLAGLGLVLVKRGDWAAAEQTNRLALDLRKEVLGENHPDIVDSLDAMAIVAIARSDFNEAEKNLLEALESARNSQSSDNPSIIPVLYHLGWVLKTQGQATNADTQFGRARKMAAKHGAYGTWPLLRGIYDVSDVLQKQGKFIEAEPLLTEAAGCITSNGSQSTNVQRDVLQHVTRFYEAWDRSAPNIRKSGKAVVWRKKLEELDPRVD
jgi:eukaryotic-like serine/threonine-protein kinase